MERIDISQLTFIGRDLDRPECVAVTRKGEIYCSDRRGGVARLLGNAAPELILATQGDIPEGLITNGFSMTPDGGFLLANLADSGGVWKLARDGTLEPFLIEVDGVTLPSINFVNSDEAGRVFLALEMLLGEGDEIGHERGTILRAALVKGFDDVVDLSDKAAVVLVHRLVFQLE
jgi:hypothetical protein